MRRVVLKKSLRVIIDKPSFEVFVFIISGLIRQPNLVLMI